MKKVAIIEYGTGNLDSVARAVEECGGTSIISHDPKEIRAAHFLILPGVGAYSVGMRNLRERNLCEVLQKQVIEKGVPFLGICLGMQLLSTTGWEGGLETLGLGWIEGEVKRLEPQRPDERVPHIGWNEVTLLKLSPLFKGLSSGKDFYFVHSYHLACRFDADVVAKTDYCGGFASVVSKQNIFGVQFHPEKSQRAGFQVLDGFLSQ